MLRDAFGVIDIVERTAAVLRRTLIREGALKFRQAALIPELHGKTDDRAALLLQNGGDGGGVHAARHGDGDERWRGLFADMYRQFNLGNI
jgi:hypothetical protein